MGIAVTAIGPEDGPRPRCHQRAQHRVTSLAALGKGQGNQWFAPEGERPAAFAGIHVPGWTSVRKVKDGATTDDLFAFLTTTPNAEVATVHPKAMPVILTEPAEWLMWMSSSWSEARLLQRPLPDGTLELLEGPA